MRLPKGGLPVFKDQSSVICFGQYFSSSPLLRFIADNSSLIFPARTCVRQKLRVGGVDHFMESKMAAMVLSNGLTLKQENFCKFFIELGNASEAYRRSYDAKKMKETSVWIEATRLMDNPLVTQRILSARVRAAARHDITVDDLIDELEEARDAAAGAMIVQSSAMVSATVAKAKLLGLEAPSKLEIKGFVANAQLPADPVEAAKAYKDLMGG